MAKNEDDIMSFKPNEISSVSKKASAFKKEHKKYKENETKVGFFNDFCGSPKEQAEMIWALEEMEEYEEDDDLEEALRMLKDLPIIRYCLDMYNDLSVLFKRAVATFLENLRTFKETSENKAEVRKHKRDEEKFYYTEDGSYVRRKHKKKDKGDSQNGVKDRNVSEISSAMREKLSEKPRESVKTYTESESVKQARHSHCKGGAGGVDFGWSSNDSGDSFFSGMSFNDDDGFGFGK